MFYNRNEYGKNSVERCDENDNICVRLPRQIAAYTERGKKIRNKAKIRRFIKPSTPEGCSMYTHRNICNSLHDEYTTQWCTDYEFAYYCQDETGSNWKDFLDPRPCV